MEIMIIGQSGVQVSPLAKGLQATSREALFGTGSFVAGNGLWKQPNNGC